MKKRLMAILMAGILSAGLLAGCGGSSSASSTDTAGNNAAAAGTGAAAAAETDAATGGYKIALIQQHQTNAFQIAVTEAAEAKAAELGVDLTILSADQDAAKQISQIEQCTSEGYQAILFEPVDPDGLGDAAQAAADKGVIMINVISACTDWENHGISALSCGDNVTAGETEMQQRLEGYENVLKNYPDMVQVVEPADCQWDTASAQGTVESWLSAYDLDAIICENDGMAVGAGNAAGADSGIIITGVDGTPDGFEAIKDGRITGTVSQDGGAMAANGIEAACKLIDGETLESNTIITTNIWIDKENVADYE